MAVNKAKRSIHLTQPKARQAHNTALAGSSEPQPHASRPERPNLNANPESTEQMPVRAHIYQTIADMNGGFEEAIQGLQTLLKINYLKCDSLSGMQNLICRIRAQANRELIAVLNEREGTNAAHFQRLCIFPESNTRP